MDKLHIGGVTPFSTIDYPDNLSAIFFFQGCVFRCPYCHNLEFQEIKEPFYPLKGFKDFIKERKGFLDAIVFSGGEPLLFPDELELLCKLSKESGFKTGLHTTGFSPERLNSLIEKGLIDWVGIDLKADMENYSVACGVEKNFFDETVKSIQILKQSGVDFEVRTTVFKEIANIDLLKKVLETYNELNIKAPVFQVYSEQGKPDKGIEIFLEKFKSENNLDFVIRK